MVVYNGMSKKEPKMRLLPESFRPSEQDVICGRGRKIFLHVGNQHFRQLVESRLQEYSNAATKLAKSCIICEMVVHIRTNNPHGGFVKMSSKEGRWYQLRDFLSREKTSQAFRDALSDQYRSTNESKKFRRSIMTHRSVSEGDFPATLQAQLKHPSAISCDTAHSGEVPAFLVPPKKGAGIVSYQPSSLVSSFRNFEWASQNVFKLIDPPKSPEIIPDHCEPTSERVQACPEQAANDEGSIFERLVLLVNNIDKGDDPFEPTPLAA
jgi:hypothetical protein